MCVNAVDIQQQNVMEDHIYIYIYILYEYKMNIKPFWLNLPQIPFQNILWHRKWDLDTENENDVNRTCLIQPIFINKWELKIYMIDTPEKRERVRSTGSNRTRRNPFVRGRMGMLLWTDVTQHPSSLWWWWWTVTVGVDADRQSDKQTNNTNTKVYHSFIDRTTYSHNHLL